MSPVRMGQGVTGLGGESRIKGGQGFRIPAHGAKGVGAKVVRIRRSRAQGCGPSGEVERSGVVIEGPEGPAEPKEGVDTTRIPLHKA